MTESLGKCAVCGKEAGALYPLLPGGPAFCSEHHNPRDAGPFGCDFTGPDDFDIPCEWELPPYVFVGDRRTFTWKDREGNVHRLKDIDDRYLANIISHLRKRLAQLDTDLAAYWSEVIVFLENEQGRRRKNKSE